MNNATIKPTNLRRIAVLGATLLCLALSLPAAGVAQDVDTYLTKMLAMYEKPFKADYTMDLQMNQGGMAMKMEGTGEMTWADATHMLLTVNMSMMMPGTDQSMKMTMRTVSDGTDTWTQIDNPMMGTQVMKVNIAAAQAMAQEQGMSANAGMSPFEQLRTLQEFFTFTVKEKSGGQVSLEGTLKDDAPAQMQEAGPMVEGMVLVLDEKTGMLRKFEMGPPGEPAMVMSLNNYRTVSKADVPSSLFSYEPPAGATVIDPLAGQ